MIEYLTIQATIHTDAEEPYQPGEISEWANVDSSDDDDLIRNMAEGAREDVEAEAGVKVVLHTVKVVVKTTKCDEIVRLPYGEPSSLIIKDSEGATITATVYGGSVKIAYAGEHTITYQVGANAPKGLKEAVKMLIAYRYNNRGDQEKQHGLPEDIERKISNYRQVWP